VATSPALREGVVFRRLLGDAVTETAQIISLTRDEAGHLHVQFNLHFHDHREGGFERRTLAADHFKSLYTEVET
jgi:hypothetical protein